MGGDYKSNRANNTIISTNDFGYDLGSNAVYKMTPFYNARYRSGTDVTTQLEEGAPGSTNPDGRLWTWGFMPARRSDGKMYVLPAPTGAGQPPAHGYFGNYCTTVAGATIAASIEAASISTAEEQRDAHLRSADFFDAERFPEITFASTALTPVDDETFLVAGELTMHGVTRRSMPLSVRRAMASSLMR